ncbi:hypothetical protein HDU93_003389, partial [Gonapodya sp. JEL0774]
MWGQGHRKPAPIISQGRQDSNPTYGVAAEDHAAPAPVPVVHGHVTPSVPKPPAHPTHDDARPTYGVPEDDFLAPAPAPMIHSSSNAVSPPISSGSPAKTPIPASAKALAVTLRDAIHSDKKKDVIDILCRKPPSELAPVLASFKEQFGESAAKWIRGNLGGTDQHLLKVLQGCAMSELEFEVWSLGLAMENASIHEDTFTDILVGGTTDETRAIKSAYQQIRGNSLEVDLHKSLGILQRDLMKLFDGVLNTDRREASGRRLDVAADARALFEARNGTFGPDQETIFQILTERPDEHLRAVLATFERQYRMTMEELARDKFKLKPHVSRALLTLIGSLKDRTGQIAEEFERAMSAKLLQDLRDGKLDGVREGRLARLAVRYRDPVAMKAIKTAYFN